MLRRNPLFAGAAVITLGLAWCHAGRLNVVNGVLLRPLPIWNPERIKHHLAWRARRRRQCVEAARLSSGS